MKIISITGTKGKTTVTRVLSAILHSQKNNTLHVDTDGYAVNQRRLGTLDQSKSLFNLVPTVCPGKYLLAMKRYFPDYVAILECSIGSSGSAGLGYGYHNIGIFTNVFEDHLGASSRLKKRSDIAKYKNFIFKNIRGNGYAIFNADDRLVTSQLKYIPQDLNVQQIPCGIHFKGFDIKSHLDSGGVCLTVEDGFAVIKNGASVKKLLRLKDVPWTFGGVFTPSVYNILFVLGGIYGFLEGKIPKSYINALVAYQFDADGGRMTLLKGREGCQIIVDYAHEKYSLRSIGLLAKQMASQDGGKTIGVVRLAPDRTNHMIHETGFFIAKSFDRHVVYDKIDGINKTEYRAARGLIRHRAAGEVSKIFYNGLVSGGAEPHYHISEEEAIKKAALITKNNDVVVVICGDDHRKTIAWVKKYFSAKPA